MIHDPSLTCNYVVGLVFTVVFFVFFLAIAISKCVMSGCGSYWSHYTNWSWTAQLVFYGFVSVVQTGWLLLSDKSTKRIFWATAVAGVTLCYVPIVVTLVAIFVAVWYLFWNDPAFVADLLSKNYTTGEIVVGNSLYHDVPIFAILLFSLAQRTFLLRVFCAVCSSLRKTTKSAMRWVFATWVVLVLVFFVPYAYALTYASFNNANSVYDTNLTAGATFLASAIVFTIIGVVVGVIACVSDAEYFRQ